MTSTAETGRDVRGADRTWLVAIAAALWGTDSLLRLPLAEELPAASVVFWEHLIVAVVLLPLLPPAVRALSRCGPREWIAVLVIGGGASAGATALFTMAFQAGDPVTPLVLQKMQPLFAMLAACVLLGERLRRGYLLFAVPTLLGAWMLAFSDPLDVRIAALRTALLALGAAALWAAGTVLGRLVSARLRPRDVTVLRFSVGLPVAAAVAGLNGAPFAVGWENATGLLLLALVPGLLALSLYYLGMRTTPASRATLAELAFPATAAIISVTVLGAELTVTQWLGLAVLVCAVTALGWHERARENTPVVVPSEPSESVRVPS